MSDTKNERYEVVSSGAEYQVVLMADELYRDAQGKLRWRRVVQRRYTRFETPLEAQALADQWNEDMQP